MKVRIGDQTYDANDQPIILKLTDQDKVNISNMLPHCTRYAAYPTGTLPIVIEKLMDAPWG